MLQDDLDKMLVDLDCAVKALQIALASLDKAANRMKPDEPSFFNDGDCVSLGVFSGEWDEALAKARSINIVMKDGEWVVAPKLELVIDNEKKDTQIS